MRFLIRAYHWQLFLVIIVVPFLGTYLSILLSLPWDIQVAKIFEQMFPALYMAGWLAWVWAVATYLEPLVPHKVAVKMFWFRVWMRGYAMTFAIVTIAE